MTVIKITQEGLKAWNAVAHVRCCQRVTIFTDTIPPVRRHHQYEGEAFRPLSSGESVYIEECLSR